MRYVYLLLIALIIPTFSSANTFSVKEIWINPKYELKVKLDFRYNRIKAKNLGRRGWTSFYKTRPGVFENRSGDRLVMEARNLIVYSRRYGRKNVVFRPVDYYDNLRDRTGVRLHQRVNPRDITGLWKVKQMNKHVEIVSRSNGIESRIKGVNKWVFYKKKDHVYYEDNNGNSYTLNDRGELIWLSDDGRTKYTLIR
jgi:predicted nucleotide-binding protein (sugar kinase/HSP70/actin superfamily)